ncbi:MAG: ROK family protein [Clostridiales bacterium]|nr:ROK family protein [Clostridiales bacterium]
MVYIGIDLGGTNIAVGVVTHEGKILATSNTRTLSERPYQEIVRDMITCTMNALKSCGKTVEDIKAIGVGIPGVADQKTGYVIFCTNLGWRNIPLKDEIQKYIDKPVYIDNDATVAGYAESVAGVSKDCQSSVFITLGTGVGAGIVINGKPWSGAHGVGSELGHMTLVADGVPCTCGNDGCVERYTSATAIIRMAKQHCQAYPESEILKRAGGDPERINAKTVIDAAKMGDKVALQVFDRYSRYLAMTINNITAFLDPEMVVLGGGVSHAGQFLLDAVEEKLPRFLMYKTLPSPRITLAKLGNEAGIIGAALLGRE